jgi:GNAT superfamily N-acetyltransferase
MKDHSVSMLLAEGDGHLLACSTCGDSRDDDAQPAVGEVRSFFVAAGRWREGVGRKLMAAVVDSLRERGCTVATLWSFAENERANAFYEAVGFTRDGARKSQDTWAHLPEVRYRRSL